jgi:hypothetical protein
MTSTKERIMLGIGPKDPKRVAERQLNQARLDLLEVATALESYQSNKLTLEERIKRLEAYLDPASVVPTKPVEDTRTAVQRVRDAAKLNVAAV